MTTWLCNKVYNAPVSRVITHSFVGTLYEGSYQCAGLMTDSKLFHESNEKVMCP